ncbi:glycoside hydrolase family protein [Mesorhizobium xinjiangense]|uniref:glycoside hydrolase family protein n=1 Tax=Mesorhizobium xinjiangense TaxID=2678685 RepID=UPI0012EDA0B2|nr:glycoside hydrolase family protein [Mesorhizobium xinjiangense]
MQTSPKGIAFLEAHEGVVLKAYRCPAGIWTIGVGLTAASGVVVPKAGMTITRAEASELLAKALRRNYEPRVAAEMPRAKQHEFDGGVSFHFNTGAIGRASWVKAWIAGDWKKVQSGLNAWVKGGGKVLPGLQRRRREEFDVIRHDRWPANLKIASNPQKPNVAHAGIVISLSADEIEAISAGLAKLGYDPGPKAGVVRLDAVTGFQRDHDLTVDGLIGRATLSTLQRELDARSKTKGAVAGGLGGGALTGAGEVVAPDHVPVSDLTDFAADAIASWAGPIVLALVAAYGIWMAFHYRDVVAARIQSLAPGLARWLRSF